MLPTAIERDILIACAPRIASSEAQGVVIPHGQVVTENLEQVYPSQKFSPTRRPSLNAAEDGAEELHMEEWHLDIDTKSLRWESYIKAGYYVCPAIPFCREIEISPGHSKSLLPTEYVKIAPSSCGYARHWDSTCRCGLVLECGNRHCKHVSLLSCE